MPFMRRRLLGPASVVPLVLWTLIGAALFLVVQAYRYVAKHSPDDAPYAAVGAGVALIFAFQACSKLYQRLYAAALKKRGVLDPNPTTFRIEDDALVCETPNYTHRLAWAGISEISRGKGYWVFFAGSINYFAPTRLFKGAEEERAFIARCREKLSVQALARCQD